MLKFISAHDVRSQFSRFAAAGIAIAIISVGVYWLLAVPLGVPPLVANLVQYLTNVGLGFVVHRSWTFKSDATRGASVRYVFVSLLALAANTLWTYVLTSMLHWPAWTPIVPMVFATPVMTFAINRAWVF